MNSNLLARFFNFQREVIEAAETPFAKLAVFTLPILAPFVPASMTGLQLFKLFDKLFDFPYATEISGVMAFIVAVVLELLGYVGAIMFIKSLFRLIKDEKRETLWLPVFINGGAYLFYVVAMWLINVQLGEYFQTDQIINNIFGLLSFITIPTGLLAANHLSQRDEDESTEKKEDKARKERLTKYAISHGMDPRVVIETDRSRRRIGVVGVRKISSKPASYYKEKMVEFIADSYDRNRSVPTVIDITKKFNLDYDKSKGFVSGVRSRWMKDKGIQ